MKTAARCVVETFEPRMLLTAVPVVSQTVDFSKGFPAVPAGLKLNGVVGTTASPPTVVGGHLRMSEGHTSQARSAFTTSAIPISQFSTTFQFQEIFNPNSSDGFTFTIQDSAPTALGAAGGALGYGGILKSVAIKFDTFKNFNFNDPSANCTGLFTGGANPYGGINLTPSGVNLHDQDVMTATLSYDGTTLTETLKDTKTLKTFSHAYAVNIPAAVGGVFAYVGFTAATGDHFCNQDIINWKFTGTTPNQGTVSGSVFNDANGNGKRDAGEKSLAGWMVYIDANNDGQFEPNETYVIADGSGNYSLKLNAGTYTLRVQVRAGYYQTAPHALSFTVVIKAGSAITADLFGVKSILPP
jgi:hypothetical protein